MTKKLLIGLLLAGSCASLLTGCNLSTKSSLTDKEKGAIKSSILEFSADGNDDLSELDKLITDNITYFDQDEKDEIIDSYVDNMFVFVDDLNSKLYTLGYELEDVVDEYDIDIYDTSTFKKIPDTHATVRGFLEELNKEGFTLESEQKNSGYYISINIQEVLDKYGNYMSNSFKNYLEFNNYEMTSKDFADTTNKKIDIDEVVNRILKLEEGLKIDKKQEYAFADKWTSSLEYYYNVLFGLSHEYFISSEYVKDDIISEYKDIVKNNKNTQLAKDMKSVLEILEKNGKRFDSSTKEEIAKVIEGIYTEEIQKVINEKYPEQVDESDSNNETDSSETEKEDVSQGTEQE